MAGSEYRRVKKTLDRHDIFRAPYLLRRTTAKAPVVEWVDTECPGLVLRITKRGQSWFIRRRDCTIKIGPLDKIGLDRARDIAAKTREAAKRGRNLKTFVAFLVRESGDHFLVGGTQKPQQEEIEYTDAWSKEITLEWADGVSNEKSELGRRWLKGELQPTWTWENLTNNFLEAKLKTLKKSYQPEYEHYLRLAEFELINHILIEKLKIGDLELVRDQMFKSYAVSTVSRAVRQAREMLTWGWSYHINKCGLENCQWEWWTRWRVEYKSKVRTRRPTIVELARTLVLADEIRNLAEGEHETYTGTVCALWMAVLTAQRTGSLLLLRPDHLFDPDPGLKLRGWKIANWTSEEMKGGRDGGRPHSLPLPPRLLQTLKRFHSGQNQQLQWTFSARRPQDPVTQSALNLLMYRMQGRVFDHRKKNKPDRPGKPGPRPSPTAKVRRNLFAEFDIKPWTLHDVRRSLTRFLDDNRLGGAASAILGHKLANEKMPEEERMAEVTEIHYNSSQRLSLKAEGMKLWVDTILDACNRERAHIKRLGFRRMHGEITSPGMIPSLPSKTRPKVLT